ncbi:MAG: hypothetical protein IT302_11510 [Dehalococcoidia bacterium]|nr:hypothetical protein [Dehalococcoidia bacterium]
MNLADLDLAPGYRRFWWVLPPAGMAVVLFTVLRFLAPGDDAAVIVTERLEQALSTRGTPTVRVENMEGSILVMGQRDSTVLATVVREGRGDSRDDAYDDLAGLESRIERDGETVTIRTWREPGPAGRGRPTVQLTVPYSARLELVTGKGDIVVNWLRGPITATTGNGDITVTLAQNQQFMLDGSGKLQSEFPLQDGATSGATTDSPSLLLEAPRGTVRIQRRGP